MKNWKTVFKIAALFLMLTTIVNLSTLTVAVEQPDPFFSLHLLAPTNNPVRMQYAQLLEEELGRIGIDAELDLVAWAAMGPRCYYDEAETHVKGGYDMCCMGMSLGSKAGSPAESMSVVYASAAIPPFGFNVMMWSNDTDRDGFNTTDAEYDYNSYRAAEQNALIADMNTDVTGQASVQAKLWDWQKIYYDAMPQLITYVQFEVHAFSTGLYGYDPAFPYPTSSITDHWLTGDYTGADDKVVVAVSAGGDMFLSILADDVYDQYSAAAVHAGLVGLTPSEELYLPAGTDRETWMNTNYHNVYGSDDYMQIYPTIAKEMGTYSADGLNYTIELNRGVKFHDGHEVDAWDVAFSFQADLVPDIGSSSYSSLNFAFGDDDIATSGGNYSFVPKDTDGDTFYETISFLFDVTYGPWITDYLGSAIYPEHILGDPTTHGFSGGPNIVNGRITNPFDPNTLWQVKPDVWKDHSMNTANTADAGGYTGPIGCGPVIFENLDSTTGTITLKKFEDIKWDGSAWVADATTDYYDIANIGDMPSEYTLVESSMDAAVADMKAGSINVLDNQWTMAAILEELQEHPAIVPIQTTETGWQAVYFNPKYADAAGVRHLLKKGVRHAVSHVVPREDVVTYLLNGQGVAAYTPVPVGSWGMLPADQLLAYKKTVVATDGSTPCENETTAYDSYDPQLALTWLETEGYDVDPHREWLAYEEEEEPAPGFEFLLAFASILVCVVYLQKRRRR